MSFQDMTDAPDDGTWIVGRNEAGETATIQKRLIGRRMVKVWCVGDPEAETQPENPTLFEPVEWRPL
jgi:hypothetical protein